ncbi:MAG: DUF423 domain-containing protein [Gemmatimonadota bacterium]
MERTFAAVGAVLALLSVGAGAFGAHGLSSHLGARELASFETAARYQMYHALALLALGSLAARWPSGWWTASSWLFLFGIALFCGSLYALSLSGARWLGAVTPLGGLCFLAGWACGAIATLRAPA